MDTKPASLPLPEGKQSHFFLCAANVDNDMLQLVRVNLENAGGIVCLGNAEYETRWNEAKDIVNLSAAFVLLLTEATLRSKVCHHEIHLAMGKGLKIVVVYESDTRRAFSVDLGAAREHLPEDLRSLLESSTDFVALGRRSDKAEEMTELIMRRAGIAVAGGGELYVASN